MCPRRRGSPGCIARASSISSKNSISRATTSAKSLFFKANSPHSPQRLGGDIRAHLRHSDQAIGEDDRDLEQTISALIGAVFHLNLEDITGGLNPLDVDIAQHIRAPADKSGG